MEQGSTQRNAVTGEPIPPGTPATSAWARAHAILSQNTVFVAQARDWHASHGKGEPFGLESYMNALTKPNRAARFMSAAGRSRHQGAKVL